jgi:hypothetical protein
MNDYQLVRRKCGTATAAMSGCVLSILQRSHHFPLQLVRKRPSSLIAVCACSCKSAIRAAATNYREQQASTSGIVYIIFPNCCHRGRVEIWGWLAARKSIEAPVVVSTPSAYSYSRCVSHNPEGIPAPYQATWTDIANHMYMLLHPEERLNNMYLREINHTECFRLQK